MSTDSITLPVSPDEARGLLKALEQLLEDGEFALSLDSNGPDRTNEDGEVIHREAEHHKHLRAALRAVEPLREALHTSLYRPALCRRVAL